MFGRLDRAAGGSAVDVGLYAISTIFAAFTARNVMLPPHGAWGRMAVAGYAAATVLAVGQLVLRRLGKIPVLTGTGGKITQGATSQSITDRYYRMLYVLTQSPAPNFLQAGDVPSCYPSPSRLTLIRVGNRRRRS